MDNSTTDLLQHIKELYDTIFSKDEYDQHCHYCKHAKFLFEKNHKRYIHCDMYEDDSFWSDATYTGAADKCTFEKIKDI